MTLDKGVGRSEIDATGIPLRSFATKSDAPPPDQDINIELQALQPVLSQDAGAINLFSRPLYLKSD
jgi:hypothetical protein